MATMEQANIEVRDDEGNLIKTIPITQANEDWIRAARLKKSDAPEDKKKLERMRNTYVYKNSDGEDIEETGEE